MKSSKRGARRIAAGISAVIALLTLLLSSCSGSSDKAPVCEIVVKDYGTITVTLDPTAAPITVKHFVELAENGAYDGSVFTRVQLGFVLQGGEGAKDNSTIKGEFKDNNVNNPLKHKKGVISMARSTSYNSASSQFFIMLADNSSLDGQYAAFGAVTEGWDVVEKIVSSVKASDYRSDRYGVTMGFLNESSYITIETVRVAEK